MALELALLCQDPLLPGEQAQAERLQGEDPVERADQPAQLRP